MKTLFKRNMGIVLAAFLVTGCVMSVPAVVSAQDPFIGEIRMFGGNFAPRGWAFCSGQLLWIADHTALFSILGTTYGGDGRTTFALPDLRGRVSLHPGTGPGLPTYNLGQRGGTPTNTLTVSQLPSHTHEATVKAYATEGESASPENNYPAKSGQGDPDYNDTQDVTMASDAVQVLPTGSSQPVGNMQPYLGINYIIALQGIFPS